MKRSRKLIYLCLVFIALAAANLVVKNIESEEYEETGTTVFTLDADSVTELSWTNEGEYMKFVYTDGEWEYAEDSEFPLDDSYIDAALEALSDIVSEKTIENPEDLSQYGLDQPSWTIKAVWDEETEILIGDETGIGGEYYLSTGDGNVYIVDSDFSENFSHDLYDMILKETIPAMTELCSVQIEADGETMDLQYLENSDSDEEGSYAWYLADGKDNKKLDTDLTEELIEEVTYMYWNRCVNYKADKEALAEYGLDSPQVTVTVNYTDYEKSTTGETDDEGNPVYETRKKDKKFVLEIGDYNGELCYARISGSEMVYLIDGDICDALLNTGYEDLKEE